MEDNNNCGGTILRLQLTMGDKGGEGTEVIQNEGSMEGSEQKSLGRMIPILDQNFTPSWGGGVSARCNSESSRFSSPISKRTVKKRSTVAELKVVFGEEKSNAGQFETSENVMISRSVVNKQKLVKRSECVSKSDGSISTQTSIPRPGGIC